MVDGFARVSYQMDWIRENSDNYVKLCSAKLIQKDICIKDEDCDTSENQICSNGQCRCKLGYSKEKGTENCVDDCVLLKELNQCSNGIFKVNKMLSLHFSRSKSQFCKSHLGQLQHSPSCFGLSHFSPWHLAQISLWLISY